MTDSVLAIDLGKTRCRAALVREGARVAAEGHGAPGLAAPNGVALAEAAILAVAKPLLGGAAVDCVGVGAAGAYAAPAEARLLAERLCSSLPARRVAVTSDAAASHLGALGGQPGVVLAVGTGAVAIVAGPDGAVWTVDGSGPWLGDDGGGASIGVAGLRAALRAADGRGPPTALTEAAEAEFGPLAALPALLASDSNPAAVAARFAGRVAGCASAGDELAKQVIRNAVAALADTVRAAARGKPAPYVVVGGLAGLLRERLRLELGAGMRCIAPAGTALDGAWRIASDAGTLLESAIVRVLANTVADRLDYLATEAVRPGLEDLDLRSPAAVVHLVLAAEREAQRALALAAPALADAAEAIAARLLAGGRLFYVGAGTPGRLAMLDAAELGPTYSAPPGMVVPLLAGGLPAMLRAVEGAEDDEHGAAAALEQHDLRPGDAVVGITASGRTPFVLAALRCATRGGALAVAIVNNTGSPCARVADLAVEILTGAELVAGSTRMMAGTAQKIALNAISTSVMIALGKTHGPYMVDVAATNVKLRRRAVRILCQVTGATEPQAAASLAQADGRVKPAIVALLAGVGPAEALQRLEQSGGRVRTAIAEH